MLPGFFEQTRARSWLRILIKVWCTVVSKFLGLRSYLLGDEVVEDDEEPFNEDGAANAARLAGEEAPGIRVHHAFARNVPLDYQPYTRPRLFPLRLLALLLCIAATLVAASFVNLTVPVALGRKCLQFIGRATDNGRTGGAVYIKGIVSGIVTPWAEVPIGPINEVAIEETSLYEIIADFLWKLLTINFEKPHELYTAIVGAGACWELARIAAAAFNFFPQGRQVIVQRIRNMFAATANYAMAAVMFLLLFGVVPLLFGLLLELVVVVPLRVPFNQTPVLFLIQDWTLGVLYTKITCALVMMGPDTRLKRAIERAYQDGVRNINLRFIVTELAIPVIRFFGLLLSVPYVLAHSIAPRIWNDYTLQRKIARWIYTAMSGEDRDKWEKGMEEKRRAKESISQSICLFHSRSRFARLPVALYGAAIQETLRSYKERQVSGGPAPGQLRSQEEGATGLDPGKCGHWKRSRRGGSRRWCGVVVGESDSRRAQVGM